MSEEKGDLLGSKTNQGTPSLTSSTFSSDIKSSTIWNEEAQIVVY